jgi:hypothetical protein
MAEWSTYSLSDFLLFAPRTYWRLFELMNEALWPAQVLAVLVGAALIALARLGGAGPARIAAILVALAWISVTWFFFFERYATINWAAEYMAWGFAAQAVLLLAAAAPRGFLAFALPPGVRVRIGRAMIYIAVLLYPALAAVVGREWRQAETFGFSPDATALAALGFALLLAGRARALLLPLPVLWCLVGGATLYTMKAPEWPLLPAAALIAVIVNFIDTRRRLSTV